MQDQLDKIINRHEFLQTYMEYVKQTESPRVMHLWSAVTAASACMGRHVCLQTGIGELYPNMFVLLVGPPGTRKSSAIHYASELVEKHTGLRFAPDDTGGQRQGLITALEGDVEEEGGKGVANRDELETIESALRIGDVTNVDAIEILQRLEVRLVHPEDQHVLFACASEFGTFMGEANSNTTRLLNKVWDGENYKYKLRTQEQVLKNPLMTIIGGTTSSDIARILPDQAIGQGFMSRWILVFAPNKETRIAEPELNRAKGDLVGQIFEYLAHSMRGCITLSPTAREKLKHMYETVTVDLQDTRFVYYQERRHTHLRKLAMALAATRRSYVVELEDVELADLFLALTELRMPEALGEFGMTPLGAAKQKLLEFLQATKTPVPQAALQTLMARDMTRKDFTTALIDLTNAKKIAPVTTTLGQSFVYVEDIASMFAGMIEEMK